MRITEGRPRTHQPQPQMGMAVARRQSLPPPRFGADPHPDGNDPRQTRKTMAHEMAHRPAAMEDGTLKHNGTFWRVMESIGYGKHHRFEGEAAGERDLHTQKSEERQAIWFWRKQPLGTRVMYGGGFYTLSEVQKRGTRVRIANDRGFSWWVPAAVVKSL